MNYKTLHRKDKQWSTKHYTEKTSNDLQNTTLKRQAMIYKTLHRKDKQWSTKHYTEKTSSDLQNTTQKRQAVIYKTLHRKAKSEQNVLKHKIRGDCKFSERVNMSSLHNAYSWNTAALMWSSKWSYLRSESIWLMSFNLHSSTNATNIIVVESLQWEILILAPKSMTLLALCLWWL